jgi:norsolorinic acid ketoreductase
VWLFFSTSAASMTNFFNISASAYGSSKAAAKFIVNAAHAENEETGLVAVALSPGWVQTDMGNTSAKANGLESAPVTLDQSVDRILKVIRTVTRQDKAQFLDFSNASAIDW